MRLAASVVAVSLTIPLGLDWHIPVPEGNPVTREKVALGRKLFFDKRLSRDGTLSRDDVIEFYSQGGRQNPNLDPAIGRRNFTSKEKLALAAFLQTLTGQIHEGLR